MAIMSVKDLRRLNSVSSITEELCSNIKMMKMKSESHLTPHNNGDAVQSVRPRTKSLSVDLKNSDSSDSIKKFQDSDSLSLKLSSSPGGSQVDTQMDQLSDTFIIDPDYDSGPHVMSPLSSDTVVLDLNENQAKPLKMIKKDTKIDKVHELGSNPRPNLWEHQLQAIIKTPEEPFVPETQSQSLEEIPKSPTPPTKRRRKKIVQLTPGERGECPLCGRVMKMKVLEEHAANCNGFDRSSLVRGADKKRRKN